MNRPSSSSSSCGREDRTKKKKKKKKNPPMRGDQGRGGEVDDVDFDEEEERESEVTVGDAAAGVAAAARSSRPAAVREGGGGGGNDEYDDDYDDEYESSAAARSERDEEEADGGDVGSTGGDDEHGTDGDGDAFRAFAMRFKLSEDAFTSDVWPSLRDAGWTYRKSGDRRLYSYGPAAPGERDDDHFEEKEEEEEDEPGPRRQPKDQRQRLPPLVFDDAKALCEYLDRYAVEDIEGNLQLAEQHWDHEQEESDDEEGSGGSDAAERRRGRKLRTDVLRHVSKRAKKLARQQRRKRNGNAQQKDDRENESGTSCDERDSKDGDEGRDVGGDEDDDTLRHSRRPRRRLRPAEPTAGANRNGRSITAAEKGADLYLNKTNRRGGAGGRRGRGRRAGKRGGNSATGGAARKRQDAASSSSMLEYHHSLLLFPTTVEECAHFSKNYPDEGDVLRSIEDEYRRAEFADWRFLLSTNHSLLLYGAGSKCRLLNSFAEDELAENEGGIVVMVRGFDKECSVDAVLDLLVSFVLDGIEPRSMGSIPNIDGNYPVVGSYNPWRAHPLVERAICISRAVACKASETLEPVFLVVHNIEGCEGLRSALAQEALSVLLVNSAVENGVASIRLVASVDHVDAPALMWLSAVGTNFNWICKEVHTRRPYVEELTMLREDESAARKRSNKRKVVEESNAQRFVEILKTLAPRHAEIVRILARMQLDITNTTTTTEAAATTTGKRTGTARGGRWIEYKKFLSECDKNFLSKSHIRPMLSELKDHALVDTLVDETSEYVRIPYPDAKLREVLLMNEHQRRRPQQQQLLQKSNNN